MSSCTHVFCIHCIHSLILILIRYSSTLITLYKCTESLNICWVNNTQYPENLWNIGSLIGWAMEKSEISCDISIQCSLEECMYQLTLNEYMYLWTLEEYMYLWTLNEYMYLWTLEEYMYLWTLEEYMYLWTLEEYMYQWSLKEYSTCTSEHLRSTCNSELKVPVIKRIKLFKKIIFLISIYIA